MGERGSEEKENRQQKVEMAKKKKASDANLRRER